MSESLENTACAASEYQRHACAFSQVQVSKAARKEAGQLKTQLTEISSNLKATVEELDKEKSSGKTNQVHSHTVFHTHTHKVAFALWSLSLLRNLCSR